MQLFNIFASLALATTTFASAIPVERRDAASVNAAITKLSNDITTLNTTLNKFTNPNDFVTALTIQGQATTVTNDVTSTTQAVNASAPFTDAESLTIGLAFISLRDKVTSVVDTLIAKKPVFSGGFIPLTLIVKYDLQQQKTASADLASAVIAKLSPVYAGLAPPVAQSIQDKFTQAIAVYS